MNTLIFLIAHAPLAHALRECALHVFADCGDDVRALDVRADAAPEQTLERARALLEDCAERPVLVLTDLFGATPCNMNLPMLLRAVSYRTETLDLLVQRAVVGGTQGVMQVAVRAPQNQVRSIHDQDPQDHQQ